MDLWEYHLLWINSSLTNLFLKGRWLAVRRDGGIDAEDCFVFVSDFGEFATYFCDNPSVKIGSEEPILPAPFTQGSLGRSRASGFIDSLPGAV